MTTNLTTDDLHRLTLEELQSRHRHLRRQLASLASDSDKRRELTAALDLVSREIAGRIYTLNAPKPGPRPP